MRRHRIVPLTLSLLISAALITLGVQLVNAATIIRVKPDGVTDGLGQDWEHALRLPQALALATPSAPTEYWVASGVYTPGTASSNSFAIPRNVTLYGGFHIGDDEVSDRDYVNNPSILSGDIGGDDDTDAHGVTTDTTKINGTNSVHVLFLNGTVNPITSTTRLNGFTITGGDGGSAEFGGGLYCYGDGGACSPHIENVTFAGNRAKLGGALFNDGSNNGESSPILVNVAFSGNSASNYGGAIYNYGISSGVSNPQISTATFVNNSAGLGGGAIFNDGGQVGESNLSLSYATFLDNSADEGGAIFNDGEGVGESKPTLANIVFRANHAENKGGAIFNNGVDGGNSSPTVTNVTFYGNTSDGDGGAIYNKGNGGASNSTMTNVILWANSAENQGDEMFNSTAEVTITTSFVEGGITGAGIFNSDSTVHDGGGNFGSNPHFVNESNGNLRLKSDSPAIDAGTNSAISESSDLDGNARIVDGDGDTTAAVDAGAYEFQTAFSLTVSLAGEGSGQVAGITCMAPCSESYAVGTSVSLTATAAAGSTFDGWDGECSGTEPCALTLDSSKEVTATFSKITHALNVTILGNGDVERTPTGEPCDAPCSARYDDRASVTLEAINDAGFTFAGWSGACSNDFGDCELTMDSAKSVTATFIVENGPDNDQPFFTSAPGLGATVGVPYSYAVTAEDADSGDIITITAPSKPAWLTLTATVSGAATLEGTPPAGNVGANAVQLRVQDGAGEFTSQEFTITVVAGNPAETGTVSGTVIDDEGKGIAGAEVTLSDEDGEVAVAALRTETTDANGDYLFEGVPVGSYSLSVHIDGKADSAPVTVTVKAGQSTTVPDVTLQPLEPGLYMPALKGNK